MGGSIKTSSLLCTHKDVFMNTLSDNFTHFLYSYNLFIVLV